MKRDESRQKTIREGGDNYHQGRKHRIQDETCYLLIVVWIVHLVIPHYRIRAPKKMQKYNIIDHLLDLHNQKEKWWRWGESNPRS